MENEKMDPRDVKDKDGNIIMNCTNYEAYLKENGKIGLKGMKAKDQITVSTHWGYEKVEVDYIEDNHIFCNNDGIEMCVALQEDCGRLIFVDRTEI
jgi:hypothetical protein